MKKITFLAATLFAAVSFGQLTNGDFAIDFNDINGAPNADATANWVSEDLNDVAKRWNVVAGEAVSNGSGSADKDLYQTIALTANTTYTLEYTYATVGGSSVVNVSADAYKASDKKGKVANAMVTKSLPKGTNGTATVNFTTTATGVVTITFVKPGSGSDEARISNVSVKEADLSSLSYEKLLKISDVVAVYTITGQKVGSTKEDVENLESGLYITIHENGASAKISK